MPISKKPRHKYKARAMDKVSARVTDVNGYMTIQGNPISKEGVFDYLGSQLPGAPAEDANKIFKVYRPAEELEKPETLNSFKLMPFIDEHNWLGSEGIDPGTLPMTGSTGETVYFERPYLRANLRVYSRLLTDAFGAGKVELSPAYRYIIDWTPGVWNGIPYDCVQRELRGNHLALVKTGRTGPDVAVMDSAPTGETKMTLEELIAAIGKLDPQQRAALMAAINFQDDAGPEADLQTDPVAPAATVDADPVEGEPEPAAPAMDADPEDEPVKAQDSAIISAMQKELKDLRTLVAKGQDSGVLMRMIGDRNALADRLSKVVGAFACDSMTLEQVAAYGIKKLEISAPKGQEVATLNGYLLARSAQPTVVTFAQDSAVNTSAAAKLIADI